MYLVHGPHEDVEVTLQTWRVLEQLYREGRLKNIGISNFEPWQLEEFLPRVDIMPAVHQVMINPGVRHTEVVELTRKVGIQPIAWSPLRNTTEQNRADLTAIGAHHGSRSWAQVLLRYYIQREIAVVPKSHIASEVRENMEVLSFRLSEEELAAIDLLRGEDREEHAWADRPAK